MGSQLTKNYDVEKDPQTLGGINGAWKIYSAHKRDRVRTPVSIFIFDKKVLEKRRTDRDEIVDRLKQEVTALTRLRHPGVLKVLEPLMEDAKMLAFVTEPVEFCLGDLLRRPNLIESYLCDLEARLGLLDLIKALGFLHTEARQVHLALSPDNIYIAENGKWRLGGLAFAQQMQNEQRVPVPDSIDILQGARSMRYEQGSIGKLAPLIYYTAPEVMTEKFAYPESDIYSLACTIYSVYKAIYDKNADICLLRVDELTAASHRTACMNALRMASGTLNVIPESMRDFIVRMLSMEISARPSLYEFSVNKAFQDSFIKAIYYLENIQEKPDAQKVQFLKGLSQIMNQFDKVIMQKRILPALISLMHIESLTGSLLPNILAILKCCNINRDNFQASIWPAISKLSTGKEISAQTLYIILSEADLLIGYTNPDQWKSSLLPLVYKAYECGVPQIQELAMTKTPDLVNKVDDKIFVKVQILPRFLSGLMKAKSAGVKEKALHALNEIYAGFDKSTLLDTVLPALEKIKKQDMTGNMVMHLLNIYEGIGKSLGPKTIATHILPALLPMLVESEVTKQQFEKLCQVLDNLIQKVKEVRIVELASIQEAQESNPIDDFLKPAEEEVHIDTLFQDLFGGEERKSTTDMFGNMIHTPQSAPVGVGGMSMMTGQTMQPTIQPQQPMQSIQSMQTMQPKVTIPGPSYPDNSQLGKVSNPFSGMGAPSPGLSSIPTATSMNFSSPIPSNLTKINPPTINPPHIQQDSSHSSTKPKGGMDLFNNMSVRKLKEESKAPGAFSADPFAELEKPMSSNAPVSMGLPGFSGYPEQTSQKMTMQAGRSNNPFNKTQIKVETEDFFSELLSQGKKDPFSGL